MDPKPTKHDSRYTKQVKRQPVWLSTALKRGCVISPRERNRNYNIYRLYWNWGFSLDLV